MQRCKYTADGSEDTSGGREAKDTWLSDVARQECLAKGLTANNTVTPFYLDDNVGPHGGIAIDKGLEADSTLTTPKSLSTMLSVLRVIRRSRRRSRPTAPSLPSNVLATTWALGVVKPSEREELEANRTLTLLDLSGNNLGSRGGKAMGKLLEANVTLTALCLGGNKQVSGGARAGRVTVASCSPSATHGTLRQIKLLFITQCNIRSLHQPTVWRCLGTSPTSSEHVCRPRCDLSCTSATSPNFRNLAQISQVTPLCCLYHKITHFLLFTFFWHT